MHSYPVVTSAHGQMQRRPQFVMDARVPRYVLVRRGTILAIRVRYPLCFNDRSFPNDVIRREHSPPTCHSIARASRAAS